MSEVPSAQDWPRPVVHFEITATDPDALAPFYEAMFNWTIHEGPIRFFAAGLGGPEPGPAGHLRQSERRGVTLYVQVRDLAESLDRAASLGGEVTMGALDVPNGPTIAGITDPEGNPITLVQQ
ncbi:MAG TPA: VOC family protein [Acidimicrobiales bacterium]|jgi:predicted enzyme related to lactoylglutathione lyase|nr:VOC family protein [Acidimicrobiales bacterium]